MRNQFTFSYPETIVFLENKYQPLQGIVKIFKAILPFRKNKHTENTENAVDSSVPAESRADQKYSLLSVCLIGFAIVLPLLWIAVLRYFMLDTGECSLDTYYHARIAEMGPEVFLAKEFPWTELSVWRTNFADKEMLYHVLLWLLFGIQDILGLSPEPPFHIPAILIFAGMLSAWVFAGLRFGIKPGLLCAGSLLFCFLAPNCTYRLMMMRPHILSLMLIMIACGIMAGGSLKKRVIGVFVLSVIYAWSYSNPHFIVIPALIFSLCHYRKDRWKVLLLPFCSLCGVLLALV